MGGNYVGVQDVHENVLRQFWSFDFDNQNAMNPSFRLNLSPFRRRILNKLLT
jgi:hypothetical protein